MHRYKAPARGLITAGAVIGVMLGSGGMASASISSPATAGPAWTRAYVSPRGASHNSGDSCRSARFRSINAAITWVRSGGTVVVCRGTYHTQAVIRKPLTLIGERAVINAKGQKGILPKVGGSGIVVLRTQHVAISGFRVTGAGSDAILVALSRHVSVTGNVLKHNGDVGVDFNGTSLSIASHNVSMFNKGGGFLVADDVGPTRGDTVSWNVASHNPGGCGVIIAGHSKFGVRGNVVAHNLLTDNGTNPKAPGAGAVIATEVPGETVSGNTVADNRIYGNGIAGVTIHSHLTGQNLSGNRIIGNWIGRNNVVGDQIGLSAPVTNVPDLRTTGILVGASSHLHVTISGNRISRNWYGIFLEGRVSVTLRGNQFRRVHTQVKVVL